jgi:hypothetical protein
MDNSYKGRYLENSVIKELLFPLVYQEVKKDIITQMVGSFETPPLSFKQNLYPDINFVNGPEGIGIRIQIILDYFYDVWKGNHLSKIKTDEAVYRLEKETDGIFTCFNLFSKSMNKVSQNFYNDGDTSTAPSEYDIHVAKTYDFPLEDIFIKESIIYSKHPFIRTITQSNLSDNSLREIIHCSYESVTWLSELNSALHFKEQLSQKDFDLWQSVFNLTTVFFETDNPLGAFVDKKLKEKYAL